MPSKLLIVESPAKAKTLVRYLGKDYTIKASMGHIRDLPSNKLAVDIDNHFAPQYQVIPAKKKAVTDLQKAADKVSQILIATDPDREGEAIAWHIAHILGKQGKGKISRVLFNEITRDAVRNAVENPGEIDLHKVDAQQARRVLDRLVGYLVSQQLWGVVAKGTSAGRVQSVALRLIVEREAEIDAFVPEEYWKIAALASVDGCEPFKVKLVKLGADEAVIPNGDVAAGVISDLESLPARLEEVRHRITTQKPQAPFTTSTLQQEAARRLRMSVKRTMSVAQRLYEGTELGDAGAVGLITYMRTDSTRVSPVAVEMARDYIKRVHGEEFLSPKPRVYQGKKGARTQDAHEAIRPTSTEWPPEKVKRFLKPEEFRLYELIWNRFLATQMADAKYAGVTVDISVGEAGIAPAGSGKGAPNQAPYTLRALGRKLIFAGFRALWGESPKEEGEKEENGKKDGEDETTELPDIFHADAPKNRQPRPGTPAEISQVEGEQKFTQPPPRYSESMLVKTLDELGIGRPSTYASIIGTIQDRKYVERDEKRKLFPTDLGKTVNQILVTEFENVFNVQFTARMEDALDHVEDGGDWTETVRKFWEPFKERIDHFKGRKQEIKAKAQERTGRTCPSCGEGELIVRFGRFGRFISCERYPDCKHIEKENGEAKREPEKIGRACPTCGEGELVKRQGRFGEFISCNRYPKCKHTEELPGAEKRKTAANLPDVSLPCPREGCGGTIVAKRSRRGKLFYSCTNWKEKNCDVVFWDLPLEQKCPECGYPIRTVKGKKLVCPKCGHKEEHAGLPADA